MDANSIYWISFLDTLKLSIVIALVFLGIGTLILTIAYFSHKDIYKKVPFSICWIILCGVLFLVLYISNVFIPNGQTYATIILTRSLQDRNNISIQEYDTLKPLIYKWIRDISGDYYYGRSNVDKDKKE